MKGVIWHVYRNQERRHEFVATMENKCPSESPRCTEWTFALYFRGSARGQLSNSGRLAWEKKAVESASVADGENRRRRL